MYNYIYKEFIMKKLILKFLSGYLLTLSCAMATSEVLQTTKINQDNKIDIHQKLSPDLISYTFQFLSPKERYVFIRNTNPAFDEIGLYALSIIADEPLNSGLVNRVGEMPDIQTTKGKIIKAIHQYSGGSFVRQRRLPTFLNEYFEQINNWTGMFPTYDPAMVLHMTRNQWRDTYLNVSLWQNKFAQAQNQYIRIAEENAGTLTLSPNHKFFNGRPSFIEQA